MDFFKSMLYTKLRFLMLFIAWICWMVSGGKKFRRDRWRLLNKSKMMTEIT